ncbi:MAG TPA: RNA polymerase sigma-70 factor [Edaphocola sp.]|nr:RNA polymerase sigma-70 factor [Edaphocola sp.]
MEQQSSEGNILPFLNSEAAFEQVFKAHFKTLHGYAYTFVKDRDVAEDMVQNTFVKLWERSGDLNIHTSLSAYLYRSVNHECLNYLKHQTVRAAHESYTRHTAGLQEENAMEKLRHRELQEKLSEALSELPEGCRTVFQLSRFEALKYRDIAEKLGISVKTVENQMGKALKMLRLRLADYLPIWLFILLIGINI